MAGELFPQVMPLQGQNPAVNPVGAPSPLAGGNDPRSQYLAAAIQALQNRSPNAGPSPIQGTLQQQMMLQRPYQGGGDNPQGSGPGMGQRNPLGQQMPAGPLAGQMMQSGGAPAGSVFGMGQPASAGTGSVANSLPMNLAGLGQMGGQMGQQMGQNQPDPFAVFNPLSGMTSQPPSGQSPNAWQGTQGNSWPFGGG